MLDSSKKLGMLQKATRGMRLNTRLWKVAVISDRYFTPYVTNNVDAEPRSLPVHSQQSFFSLYNNINIFVDILSSFNYK